MAFGVNEALKRAFPDNEADGASREGPPSLLKPFAMGAITGCCSATVLLPSEIVKAKTQVVTESHVTSKQIIRQMLQKQGVRSMFIGFDAQLARDSSFYALFFGGYEMSCYMFRTFVPSMPDELNYFLSGGIAGMGGWLFAMPVSLSGPNLYQGLHSVVNLFFFIHLTTVISC
jgi:Mitochondrial carrier protein